MTLHTYGTETSEGFIPHIRHKKGFLCPVRLKVDPVFGKLVMYQEYPVPERTPEGKLVFALPGGGTWVPGIN